MVMNRRNPDRKVRKQVHSRTRRNALSVMTPQGQALWAAEYVDNAAGSHLVLKEEDTYC